MNHQKNILDYIRRNRVSTTEVADALGKTGVLPKLSAITPDLFRAGPVHCVFTAYDSNYALHDQLRSVQEGEIVIVFAHCCDERALFGDLVSRYTLLYRRAEALVVNGLMRDAARLRRERYPIWAQGASPLGCFNTPADPFPTDLERKLREDCDGGVAVCDDGGVTVIPRARLNADTLERLERIELQEDIWYYCLNTLKWDTKKIVCDKAYLKEREMIPTPFLDKFEALSQALDSKK
ncbi:MAG: RraA family protein [Elusimicrobiota bacterium]|jgi:regulator of RNase E activity RraA